MRLLFIHCCDKAKVVFYTQADKLLEKKRETVAYTLAEINVKVLFKKRLTW